MSSHNCGKPHSDEHKLKISIALKGKRNALGTKRSPEFRKKLSDYWKANVEKHNHYKDGKYAERKIDRVSRMNSLEYRLWRENVFSRDDWSCVKCLKRGGKLEADHIKPYATHPELRIDLSNGRTLCKKCHRSRHIWDDEYNTFLRSRKASVVTA